MGVEVTDGAVMRTGSFNVGPFANTVIIDGGGSRIEANSYLQPSSEENRTIVRNRGVLDIGGGDLSLDGGVLTLDGGIAIANRIFVGAGRYDDGSPGGRVTPSRLEGSGLLLGTVILDTELGGGGGVLAPGGSSPIGEIDILGQLVARAGLLEIQIEDPALYDVISVFGDPGSAHFNGATIRFILTGLELPRNTRIDFLRATSVLGFDTLSFELLGSNCTAYPRCYDVRQVDGGLAFFAATNLSRVPEPSALLLLLLALPGLRYFRR
jgi:hypothetical protein